MKAISIMLIFLFSQIIMANKNKIHVSLTKPQIYGRVSKHVIYADQSDHGIKKLTNARGIDNAESRVGLKGKGELNQFNITADYNLEIGINSTFMTSQKTNDPASNERIRIRHSKVSLTTDYGKLIIGQTTPLIGQRTIKLDPLNGTIASIANLGQRNIFKHSYRVGRGGLGSYWRGRPDLISYQSPLFKGINYALSIDKGQSPSTDPSQIGNYGKTTNYEHLINYHAPFKGGQLDLFMAYISAASSEIKHDFDALSGALIQYEDYKIGLSYIRSQKKDLLNKKQNITKIFASLGKSFQKHALAATYNYADDQNNILGKDQRQTQYALGYTYKLFSHFKLTTVLLKWVYEDKKDSSQKNSVLGLSQGFEVKF